MSRKTRAFRVFLHQNQNPTIKQTWDTAWKRAQKIFHARSMQDMEEKLAAVQAECKRLRKDAERYRWLRKGESDDVAVVRGLGAMDYGMSAVAYTYSDEIDGDDLDAAIDAALAGKGATK